MGKNRCLRLAVIARKKIAENMSKRMKGSIPWNKGKRYKSPSRQGRKFSDEHRMKLSLAHLGRHPWNFGKPMSEEAKENLSEKMKGKNPWMKGRKHTSESKQKMSISHKNMSQETRDKISESLKGHVPWNKGKKASEETLRKKWKLVVQCDQSGNVVNKYMSVNEACANTGILKSSISNCLHGRSVTAGGFFWKFSEDK